MTQPRRRYEVAIEGERFVCLRVRGREAVSAPFRFDIALARAPFPHAPAELVGSAAELVVCDDATGTLRTIHAVVTECVRDLVASATPAVTLVLEPRLALLRARRDVRSFLDASAVATVEAVLAAFDLACDKRLGAAYPTRDYCVQWRESDLDFAARLLEDEGIAYWVADDGHVTLGDGPAAWDDDGLALPCEEGLGLDAGSEAVVELGWASELVPRDVLLRDYDFERPRLDLAGRALVPATAGRPGELPARTYYDFPGELLGAVDPARRAALHAEAFAAQAGVLSGVALTAALRPGAIVRLEHTPEHVAAGRYVVLAVEHDFDRERSGFALAFTALPAEQPYRPPRVTPVPEIAAPHSAFVVGPEDIHTDAWGRVELHFPWDRRRSTRERTSAWVPSMQDNTGHSCTIPRRGWEVVVQYLEGDPDRPVILGRVYNGGDPPPDELPANKTRSRIQSLVSPSRGGMNMIELDDNKGQETLRVYAQKDHTVSAANDRRVSVLTDETWHVEHDESLAVGRDRRTQVGGDVACECQSSARTSIAGERRVDVNMAIDSAVSKNSTLVTPLHLRHVGTHDSASGGDKLVEAVGGVVLEAARENHGTRADGPVLRAVGGAMIDLGPSFSASTAGKREDVTGGVAFALAGERIGIEASATRTTMTPAHLSVTAAGAIDISAGTSFGLAAGTALVTFPTAITLKVGDTTLTAKDGALTFGGSAQIRLTIAGTASFATPFIKQI